MGENVVGTPRVLMTLETGQTKSVSPSTDAKHIWVVALPEDQPVQLTSFEVSPPEDKTLVPISVDLPAGLLYDDPVVVLVRPAISKADVTEAFVRNKIWGEVDPRETSNVADLFEWLQMTNVALAAMRETPASGKRMEAQASYAFLRVLNDLQERHWLAVGEELSKSAKQSEMAIESATKRHMLEKFFGKQANQAVKAVRIHQAQKAKRIERIHKLITGESPLSADNCDAAKVRQFIWMLAFVSKETDAETEHFIRSMKHEWDIAGDLAMCARYFAGSNNEDDVCKRIEVLDEAIGAINKVISLAPPRRSGYNYRPSNSVAELNEKRRGLEAASGCGDYRNVLPHQIR
jgi:hypothetical protein